MVGNSMNSGIFRGLGANSTFVRSRKRKGPVPERWDADIPRVSCAVNIPAVPAFGEAGLAADPTVYRFLARQPILDIHGRVRAYELLFRDGVAAGFQGDGDLASRTMIDNSILFGLQNLTNGLPAFVNCTAETLLGDSIHLLPPSVAVLEVLETVKPTKEIVAACYRLKAAGYRLALDDFLYEPSLEPLIEIADYIKIDYLNTSDERRILDLTRLDQFTGELLAEKVEDEAGRELAREEGCSLFQGYYFAKPSMVRKQKVPPNQHVHLRLLELLHENPLNLLRIEESVKSEPSLAYRLLRYVNSPLFGIAGRITSIRTALIAMGDDQFRRIAALAVTSELNCGPSGEIVRMALVRARFCEMVAGQSGLQPTEQYLMGLFSMLPAMLQKPMEEAVGGLSLRTPLREALLGVANAHRYALDWLESYERGEFEQADMQAERYRLGGGELGLTFTQASIWADELLGG